jgi:integrase
MAARKKARHGEGSVYYRHPANGRKGCWVAAVTVVDPLTGRSRRITRTAATRDGARGRLAELQDAPAAEPAGTAPTFAGWLETWRTGNLQRLPLKPRTKEIYAGSLKWYAEPAAGSVLLSDLTPSVAEAWLERVRQSQKKRGGGTIASSTARGTFVATSRALDTAVRDGLIPSNPLASVERPRAVRAVVPATGADDVEKVLAACRGRRIEPLAWLVAFTGIRVSEGLGLTWSNVDLRAGTALILVSAPGADSTKSGRWRQITLVDDVVAQLQAWRAKQAAERLALGAGWQGTGDRVFTTATGRTLDRRSAGRQLGRVLEQVGVTGKRPWHSLRHGLAHRLIMKGVPLPLISAMLGHSSIAITVDLYGHVQSAIPADVLTRALDRPLQNGEKA